MSKNKEYIISDFNRFHNEEFVIYAYKTILNREPDDQGKINILNELRSGEKTKTQILCDLRFSDEGKKNKIKILGIQKRNFIYSLSKIPFLGYIVKSLQVLLRMPTLVKRMNIYESEINNTAEKINQVKNQVEQVKGQVEQYASQVDENFIVVQNAMKEIVDILNLKADNEDIEILYNAVQSKAEQGELLHFKEEHQDLKLYLQTVSYAKEYMRTSQQNMQNLIDEVKKRLPDELLNQKELLAITEEEKHKFDNFYLEFEDHFRGTREDIKQRLEVYLPYIENLPSAKEDIKVLDVGCGRGEWIELLAENGYNAYGIDLNRIMVAKSQELGLKVQEADVIEHLHSLENESLSVITGFHIIEHLPFEVLMKMYDESLRVLKPGGMVIFETPNPENLIVGACNFYIDPTHINPLVPKTMDFMLQQRGFSNVEIHRLHKYSDYYPTEKDDNFKNNHFYNEMDYAIIGYKK